MLCAIGRFEEGRKRVERAEQIVPDDASLSSIRAGCAEQ
jgi:hypothetical protein